MVLNCGAKASPLHLDYILRSMRTPIGSSRMEYTLYGSICDKKILKIAGLVLTA